MSSKSTRHVLVVADSPLTISGAVELRSYAIITDGAADAILEFHEGSDAVPNLIWEDACVGADLAKTRSFPSDPRERPFSVGNMLVTLTGTLSRVIFYTGTGA